MTTHKGRVVYDRKPHLFTYKDIVRITRQTSTDKSPRELARYLWGIDIEIIKLKVIDDEAILEFVEEFLALVFAWAKNIGSWLWDLVLSWLGVTPAAPVVEISSEETETEGENASD